MKDIGKMSYEELKTAAQENGINIEGKSVEQLKTDLSFKVKADEENKQLKAGKTSATAKSERGEIKSKILALYGAGKTVDEIVAETGYKRNTVYVTVRIHEKKNS